MKNRRVRFLLLSLVLEATVSPELAEWTESEAELACESTEEKNPWKFGKLYLGYRQNFSDTNCKLYEFDLV